MIAINYLAIVFLTIGLTLYGIQAAAGESFDSHQKVLIVLSVIFLVLNVLAVAGVL